MVDYFFKLLYYSMEANCFIFPSPKSHAISEMQDKIILIPQNPLDNQHILYSSLCGGEQFKAYDQFADFIKTIQDNSTPRTEENNYKNGAKVQGNSGSDGKVEGVLKTQSKVKSSDYIPCLFLSGCKDRLIVFFHANGEDISSAYQFLKLINLQTRYPVLAMEYRGYSIFQGETTPKNIETDASRLMDFLMANKFTSNEMILFGRSIGCAVALTVTQKYSIYCTVLLSPFISLKKVAKDLYCGCAGSILKEAFDNEQNCRQIPCPLLIIHGAKDTLVPYQHSLKLMSGCQSYCRLKIIENMTHTKFNFRMDFIRHMNRFLLDLQ